MFRLREIERLLMINELKWMVRYVLGIDIPGENFPPLPDDTFIISYPRSGNTWARFLITNLMHPEAPASFDLMERTIPDTTGQTRRSFRSIPRPRLIKCHRSFDSRVKRLIYMVRDPRDVAVSFYHLQRKYRLVEDDLPLESFVERFVTGHVSDFGSWGENVASWLAARFGSPNFLLIRYEDLLAETAAELSKIAVFLKVAADQQRLSLAIERSTPDLMRKLEALEHDKWSATRGYRKDIPFVGPAKANTWQDSLPTASVTFIESAWGPLMKALGYRLTKGGIRSLAPPFIPDVSAQSEEKAKDRRETSGVTTSSEKQK